MTSPRPEGRSVLFLGGVFPRKNIDATPVDLDRYGVRDQAADAYQWKLITGLERNLERQVTIISAPFVTKLPGRSRCIPSFQWRHETEGADYSVGFFNALGIRNLTRELALTRPLSMALAAALTSGDSPAVIAYSMNGPFLQHLARIKRQFPSVTTCLVVPDLPQHTRDPAQTSWFIKLLKFLDSWRNGPCLKFIDKFVLISQYQAEALNLEPHRFVTVEGMVDPSESQPPSGVHCSEQFTVVYTGTLARRYGVVDLVDALDHLSSPAIRLVICGDGDAAAYVNEKAHRDERLLYLGRVDHSEAMDWQRRADVLINPRPGSEEFTRYSFPSKTLEYLLAGRPLLAYGNPGIPEEYAPYMIKIREPGSTGIAAAVDQVMALPRAERERMGEDAQRFVLCEKSNVRQAARVLQLLEIAS